MRKIKSLAILPALLALTTASNAVASTEQVTNSSVQSANGYELPWRAFNRFEFFGGASYGYSGLQSAELDNTDGTQFNLSLLGSLYRDNFIVDLGAGWSENRTHGIRADGTSATIRTRSPFAELSPRVRLGRHWQIGPVIDLEFGTPLSFDPNAPGSSGDKLWLAGGKLVYEIVAEQADFRFSVKPMADLNIPGRQLFLVSVGLEIGIPFSSSPPAAPIQAAGRVPEEELKPAACPAPAPLPVPATAPKQVVLFTLPASSIHFRINSAELDAASLEFLRSMGRVIGQTSDHWKRLQITGHTDATGVPEHNLGLSLRRAQSVSLALQAGGAPKDRLQEFGLGAKRPIDPAKSAAAYYKNRRVELLFEGVQDTQALDQYLKAVK